VALFPLLQEWDTKLFPDEAAQSQVLQAVASPTPNLTAVLLAEGLSPHEWIGSPRCCDFIVRSNASIRKTASTRAF
jgi:hypothetical protein